MKNLTVNLKDNPYRIIISQKTSDFLSCLKKTKADIFFIITDENVAKVHLKKFSDTLKKQGVQTKIVLIKAGEKSKSIKTLSRLYDQALKEGLNRKSAVIAFGGGVVGDLAGFFASTYMRGIKLIQVPTTLLAMTDSSVGGKTAVTTESAKNIAGTFKQPELVWINSEFLSTLPTRQLRNGMAEVLKYAIAFDKKFYAWLLAALQKQKLSAKDFDHIIYRSCFYKAAVVEKDEKDEKGIREILNLGHTLAHAIETQTKYKRFLHGEAVAIGLLFAVKLSCALGLAGKNLYEDTRCLLSKAGLTFDLKGLKAEQLFALMKKDKKAVGGQIRFVLLKDIGKTVCAVSVKEEMLQKEIKNFLREEMK